MHRQPCSPQTQVPPQRQRRISSWPPQGTVSSAPAAGTSRCPYGLEWQPDFLLGRSRRGLPLVVQFKTPSFLALGSCWRHLSPSGNSPCLPPNTQGFALAPSSDDNHNGIQRVAQSRPCSVLNTASHAGRPALWGPGVQDPFPAGSL